MKRKRRKLKRISVFIILIFFLVVGIIYFSKKDVSNNNEEIISEKPTKEEYKVSLIMAGDALVHDRLYNDAYRNGIYDFKPYLSIIKEKVKNYDLAYYNQETILGGTSIGLSSYPSFNSPQELGNDMISYQSYAW